MLNRSRVEIIFRNVFFTMIIESVVDLPSTSFKKCFCHIFDRDLLEQSRNHRISNGLKDERGQKNIIQTLAENESNSFLKLLSIQKIKKAQRIFVLLSHTHVHGLTVWSWSKVGGDKYCPSTNFQFHHHHQKNLSHSHHYQHAPVSHPFRQQLC